MHTHLVSPNFGEALLWGVDELLTYHYLIAEVMRWSDMKVEDFWKLSKKEQADLIWQKLFIEHSPISEACRGVLSSLEGFGLDLQSRDMEKYRAYFNKTDAYKHVDKVLELSNVDNIVMTNDPFDEQERIQWLEGKTPDPRFHAALRIDPLLNDYAISKHRLLEWGYQVDKEWTEQSIQEVCRFLKDWIKRMNPLYMAVSLPPTFTFPEDSDRGRIIKDCVIPVSREMNIPFAMMIGVKKRVHPELEDAGDYLAKASTEP